MFLPLHYQNRKVAQLVAHYVRDVGVGRSSRLFPTEAKERIFYILSFFVQSFISEIPPLSDRKERIFYILSFFVQSFISEMSPIYDRNVSK